MSKQINPTYIGGFVLGGLMLSLVLLVVLGGGFYRNPSARYVMFFEGSISGLRVGAPVTFRGVKVGTVTDVALKLGKDAQSINIPVYVEFDEGRISAEWVPEGKKSDTRELVDVMVSEGLRAQLQVQSFVTGQLQVDLDFFPDKPIRMTGLDGDTPELPTVPSPFEALTKKFEKLPISDIVDQIARITEGIDRIVNSTGTEEAVKGLADSIIELRGLVKQISERFPDALAKMEETIENANRLMVDVDASLNELTPVAKVTMEQLRKTAALETGRSGELAASLEKLIGTAEQTLKESEQTLTVLRNAAAPDSPLLYQVRILIEDLSDASRAVRSAADYLDRHPESIIRGKGRGE